jgi:hypothetical protein
LRERFKAGWSFAEFEARTGINAGHLSITGLLQTEDYARALIETSPGIDAATVGVRVAARMQRQQRVLYRDDPPRAWFIADELALFRCVGSPVIMAAQPGHVAEVAVRPNVTVQVLPAVAHASRVDTVPGDAVTAGHVRCWLAPTGPTA